MDYKRFQLAGFEFMDEARERSWYIRWALRVFGWLPLAPLDQSRPVRPTDAPLSGRDFTERLCVGVGFTESAIVKMARHHGERVEE